MFKEMLIGLGAILTSYTSVHANNAAAEQPKTKMEQKIENKGLIMPKELGVLPSPLLEAGNDYSDEERAPISEIDALPPFWLDAGDDYFDEERLPLSKKERERMKQKIKNSGMIMPRELSASPSPWLDAGEDYFDEEELPAPGEDWDKEKEIKLKNKLEAEVKAGEINNTLMGRPFSDGYYIDIDANGKINIHSGARLNLGGRIRIEDLNYNVGPGSVKNFDVDISTGLEQFFYKSETCTAIIGLGINFDAYKSVQTFEDVPITVYNIAVGPELGIAIDSKYFDFSLVTGAGLGEAGNDVHGSSDVIKAKSRMDIAFEFNPIRIEGYGELEINLWESENVDRSDYTGSVGIEVEYEVHENVSLTGTYEHRWIFGNQDNIESDITAAGLKIKY